MTDVLVQVTAPHFCAAFIMRGTVAIEAAPILRWAIGKSRDALRYEFARRGWKAIVVGCGRHGNVLQGKGIQDASK